MTKRVQAKHKIDRRLGENIWGRPKSPLNKREYAPRPARRAPHRQDLGLRPAAQGQAEAQGLLRLDFRAPVPQDLHRGHAPQGLDVGAPDRPARALVYRAKFVPTVFAARQFVSHGHVTVNGRRVTIPSYRLRVGDVIEVREKGKQMPLVLEAIKSAERDVPEYVEADHSKMTAKLIRVPVLSDVPYPVTMEPNLVVEFYSRCRPPAPNRIPGRAAARRPFLLVRAPGPTGGARWHRSRPEVTTTTEAASRRLQAAAAPGGGRLSPRQQAPFRGRVAIRPQRPRAPAPDAVAAAARPSWPRHRRAW